MPGKRNKEAFTIIEIIIVMIILGITAGLAIPRVLGPSMEKASFSEAVQHLSAYVIAEKSYALDHNWNYTGDCSLLEVEVTFKGYKDPDCNDGAAGHVSVERKAGGSAGVYTVKVDATQSPPVYSCVKGGGSCPSYLTNLLPK